MYPIEFPEALTRASFLAQYWQKKPLYMPDAWPALENPISAEELAGLALDVQIPSRIVQQHSCNKWTVRDGPFTKLDFARLDGQRWSLLITDIEKHLPALMAYVQPFRFIPDWRFDDFMISYAPPGGSVGPHLDDYDVFLIQVEGERNWQLENQFRTLPLPEQDIITDTDLRLIKSFKAREEYCCSPGDILYLPPRIGHHGIAKTDCMTWSMGFKAPNFDEMLGSYFNQFAAQNEHKRYTDPGLSAQSNAGEITQQQLRSLKNWFTRQVCEDDERFARWVGKFLSRDFNFEFESVREVVSETLDNKDQAISGMLEVETNPFVSFNFMRLKGQTYLFVAGQEYKVSDGLAKKLTQKSKVKLTLANQQDAEAISSMINHGFIFNVV